MLEETFTFIDNLSVLLLIFIIFRSILVNFLKVYNNQEIQDGGYKLAAVCKHDVIGVSRDVIRSCCGSQRKHFWTYYLPSKFGCHILNILQVKERAESVHCPEIPLAD